MLGFSSNCDGDSELEHLRMHTESCPSLKLNAEFDANSTLNNTSILEDDLALSSSTLGPPDKSFQESEHAPCDYKSTDKVVYVNEDTMDCNYSAGTPSQGGSRMDISSPEMFESDDEDHEKRGGNDFGELVASQREKNDVVTCVDLEKCEPSEEELIVKSDSYLLARMNKFLTGVPPPPKHTICQSDCSDLLAYIRENREYFVIDPLLRSDENTSRSVTPAVKVENIKNPINGRSFNHRAKSSLRNLTNAFDACDRSNESTTEVKEDSTSCASQSNADNVCKVSKDAREQEILLGPEESSLSDSIATSIASSTETCVTKDNGKHVTFKMPKEEPTPFYSTISVEEARKLEWDIAYKHKTHGIHYNRSKTMEEFESLTLKLCQRYIGAETQSSCNIWFTKQAPTSVKKRNLLRRNNGQSPGKRLSHLARRRRTFSSANLQGLGMADKKQFVLNTKKPTIRKGKSPRGKSPRGSAKKRASLRPSPSPRKSKLETSKRALFQSPPNDRAEPSSRVASLINSNPQQRIRRVLQFGTSKTKEDEATVSSINEAKKVIPFEESRKRKSEDNLEGPKFKLAKSLSFDCAHSLESNSADSWPSERHSTGSFLMKSEAHLQQGKCELSETHRKKLLWAVAAALRARGVGMGHPRFKQYASQLAKTVKKYMPDLENRNVPRKPGSTSDRMLKLAKHHVLLIVESRPAE